MSRSYYNEFEPHTAAWLRQLIANGHLPPGDVDTRSITDVQPDDLAGYTSCHFFAGIGGWPYAARLAGWPNDRPIWTGSPPCQPFSTAGKGKGAADDRHLWPHFFRLIAACRPPVVFGEQVAAAVGHGWFDGVRADLENAGYASRAFVIPACAVNAPHRRDRLWLVADSEGERWNGGEDTTGAAGRFVAETGSGIVADADHTGSQPGREPAATARHWHTADADGGCGAMGRANQPGLERRGLPERKRAGERAFRAASGNPWADAAVLQCGDGKNRRVKPGVCLVDHGIPSRVVRLRGYGNAIVPQVAAEIIGAYLEAEQMT